MGIFEKYLSIWVALAIIIGTFLGYISPGFFNSIAHFEFENVNLLVALLIWLMIFPPFF